MIYGTKVTNPTHHRGSPGFVPCTFCAKLYTKLGVARHWDKCPDHPNAVIRDRLGLEGSLHVLRYNGTHKFNPRRLPVCI